MAQVAPDAVDNSVGDLEKVQELAGLLTAEDVQLYYQIGTKGREDLKLAVEMRSAFEMVLLRMLVFSPNYMAPAREAVESERAASSVSEKKKPTVTVSETSLSPEDRRPKCENKSHSTDASGDTRIDVRGSN